MKSELHMHLKLDRQVLSPGSSGSCPAPCLSCTWRAGSTNWNATSMLLSEPSSPGRPRRPQTSFVRRSTLWLKKGKCRRSFMHRRTCFALKPLISRGSAIGWTGESSGALPRDDYRYMLNIVKVEMGINTTYSKKILVQISEWKSVCLSPS